jgi:hypothetical protein
VRRLERVAKCDVPAERAFGGVRLAQTGDTQAEILGNGEDGVEDVRDDVRGSRGDVDAMVDDDGDDLGLGRDVSTGLLEEILVQAAWVRTRAFTLTPP